MLDMPEEIGLIGPAKVGVTGLVRSLVGEACSPGASLFAKTWRLKAAPSAQYSEDEAAERQKTELLDYLIDPQNASLRSGIREFFVAAHFDGQPDFAFQLRKSGAKKLRIFDTSQGGIEWRNEPGWVAHAYANTPHIVLCYPVNPSEQQLSWYEMAFDRLFKRLVAGPAGAQRTALRTLVVAFTHFERMFDRNPRQAGRRARTPAVARECLRQILSESPRVAAKLRELSDTDGLRVVGIPVSAYGFVPGDEQPNYDLFVGRHADRAAYDDEWTPEPFGGAHAVRLLTRPDIFCRQFAEMNANSDSVRSISSPTRAEQTAWLLRHWRPFLTADPFISCVSGDSHELVFSLPDLLEESRMHRFV